MNNNQEPESQKIYLSRGDYRETTIKDNATYIEGDFIKVKGDYIKEKRTGPTTPPNKLPFSGIKTFVGRNKDLEQLHQKLQVNQRIAITTVTGMGGIGKTELAIQYALKYADPNSLLYTYKGGVCWLKERGENIASQIITFSKVQLNLNIPEELDIKTQVSYCWQNWHFKENVLVIFDDVTDYKNIKDFIPLNPKFKIIVTTRLTKLAQAFKHLELDVLNKSDALTLLKSLVEPKRINAEIEIAEEICEWLGRLPLGLELVGQYLAEREDLSLSEILERLKKKRLEQTALREPTTEITAELGVSDAFELSWEKLSEEAKTVAYFLCLFALAPIPWNLVEEKLTSILFSNEKFGDEEDLEDIRERELLKRSLLKRTGKKQYQLHQLVQEFIRNKLESKNIADNLKEQYCQLMINIAQQVDHSLTLKQINNLTPYIPHLENTTNFMNWIANNNLFDLFNSLGRYYEGQGLYSLAENWYKKYLKIDKTNLEEENIYIAQSLNNLADSYTLQERYNEAEPLYKKALNLAIKLLGEEHPDIIIPLNNLGKLYTLQKKHREAKTLHMKALNLAMKLLGEEHIYFAFTIDRLAELYESQKRYKKSESFYLRALRLYKKILGEEHIFVANCLNKLGTLYRLQERYSESEAFQTKALNLKIKLLGEEHPKVLSSLNSLALLYESQEKYIESENLHIKILNLRIKLLGEENIDVANSLSNLASLYKSQGKYSKAESLYLQALNLTKQLLGEENPRAGDIFKNFASLIQRTIEENRTPELSNNPITQSTLKNLIN